MRKKIPGISIQPIHEVEFQKDFVELHGLLLRLDKCVKNQISPGSNDWPTGKHYRAIIKLVQRLDPKSKTRRKHHPFWKMPVACVDNAYGDLLLRDRVQRFVEFAEDRVPKKKDIPPISERLFREFRLNVKSSKPEPKTPEIWVDLRRTLDGSRQPTGDRAQDFLKLSSRKFQKLFGEASRGAKSFPKDCWPIIEYAAALDAAKAHQNFASENLRWLNEIGHFLATLENEDFDSTSEAISEIIGICMTSEEALSELDREQKRRRTLKSRRKN